MAVKKKAKTAKKAAAGAGKKTAARSAKKAAAKRAPAKKAAVKKAPVRETATSSAAKAAAAAPKQAAPAPAPKAAGRLKVTLVKSVRGRLAAHQACAIGLGLRRRHQTVEVEDTPCTRGMINRIHYLLEVEGQ